ncbi:MAG: MarR family transcriptional regulator [Anaerolineae bacterium]
MTVLVPPVEFARRLSHFRRRLRRLTNSGPWPWLDVDLTMAQARALYVIASEGTTHGRVLAQALGIGAPAVSKLVDQLVERGMVSRREDADDRRVVWLQPTDEGQALVDQLTLSQMEGLRNIVAALSPAELRVVTEAWRILDRTSLRLLEERDAILAEDVEAAVS